MTSLPTTELSIVVPVYSGDQYIPELFEEIKRLRETWLNIEAPIRLSELIFVNDDAADNSPAIITELGNKHGWVTALNLSKNFGQHPATIAGILHSSGDLVATLDEDLQHHPDQIPGMIRKLVATNSDIIYAKPLAHVHKSLFRDLSSRFYKFMIGRLTGQSNLKKINSFRLMRGSIARAASSVSVHDIYFDVALQWFSNRIETCELKLVDKRYVESGESGYSLKKLLSHARRMLMSSQVKVLRFGALIGITVCLLSVMIGALLIGRALLFPEAVPVQGWTSLMVTQMFFGGSILFLVGVMIEYLSLMLQRGQGKPMYFTIDRSTDESLRAFFLNEKQ